MSLQQDRAAGRPLPRTFHLQPIPPYSSMCRSPARGTQHHLATFHLDSEASVRLTAEQANFFLVKHLEPVLPPYFKYVCKRAEPVGPRAASGVVLQCNVSLLTAVCL